MLGSYSVTAHPLSWIIVEEFVLPLPLPVYDRQSVIFDLALLLFKCMYN